MTDNIRLHLPAELLGAYDRSTSRMTPTLMKVRFGNTPAIAKRTSEAAALADAADQARRAWESIHSLHWSSASDTTATEGARLVRSAKFAKQQMEQINTATDAALTAAERRLETLKAKMDAAIAPPASAGVATMDAEARAMLRATTDPAAALKLARAHPRAVATASPELCGLAPEVHANIRTEHLRTTLPEETADYSDLLEAVQAAGAARKELESSANDMIDFSTAGRLAGGAA
ncbi:hypothetical protein [Dyella telluris]|uniref:Uncharacterized protein n=1 Tax=Dyella telluris TaxID=2763498 RepID=A0A7G8Q1S4_9GAMM|nr:hypothetical protein [Dyella telluris]QNK00732.1 hypothetical protein H8F01_16815 [Dyella telluris]